MKTHVVVSGQYGTVRLSDEAKHAYDELKARTDQTGMKQTTLIGRYFGRFAELGPTRLDNPKMFKAQGKFRDGTGKKVQVFEFKAYQWRVYGVLKDVGGTRCFVGMCVDPDKKKDKADRSILERCARMSSDL